MRPVSDRFLRTVRGSHRMSVRARVCTTFQIGTEPDGTFITVLDGDVQLDGTAQIRSTLELTVDGNQAWPAAPSDLFAPYGNEIFIERGIAYGGGQFEWCSLGYHRIQEAGQDQAPNGPIRISGLDRMAGIRDGRLLSPLQFATTALYGDIVDQLVTEVYPDATIEWDDASDSLATGRSLVTEDDRFGFLDDLVTSLGKIWYWDHRGVLVIKAAPDPGEPVFDVDAGAGGVLISKSRTITRDGVYNAVVASGDATDTQPPVTAVAVDNNPASPTYFYGPFGPVPRFYSSPFLTTPDQAASAAASVLGKQIGATYTMSFTAVPNPALEPWDPVRVRTSDGPELHVLSTVRIPLTADGALESTTREQSARSIAIL